MRIGRLLLLLFACSTVFGAESENQGTKTVTILHSSGSSRTIPLNVILSIDQVLADSPEVRNHVVLEHSRLSAFFYKDHHFVFQAPEGVTRKNLPTEFDEKITIAENVAYLETWDALLLQYPKTNFPLLDVIRQALAKTNDRSEEIGLRFPFLREGAGEIVQLTTKIDESILGFVPKALSWPRNPEWQRSVMSVFTLEIEGKTVNLYLFGKFWGGFARKKEALRSVRKRLTHPVHFVDTGGNLVALFPDKQFRPEAVTDHAELGFSAMVPNRRDLEYEKEVLNAANALPLISANVMLKPQQDGDPEKPAFLPYRIETVDGLRIGYFGLTDRDETKTFRLFEIKDPLVAAKKAVTELLPQTDLIVAVTNLKERDLTALKNEVVGIDIVIGHEMWPLPYYDQKTVRLAQNEGKRARNQPYLITDESSAYGGQIDLSFSVPEKNNHPMLRQIDYRPLLLDGRWSSEPVLSEREESRMVDFTENEEVLLPDIRQIFPEQQRLTTDQFYLLICHLLLKVTSSEVCVLPKYFRESFAGVPGEIMITYVKNWLKFSRGLMVLNLKGSVLNELLQASEKERKRETGFWHLIVGIKNGSINGRPISDDEYYQIVSSTFFAENREVFSMLSDAVDPSRQKFLLNNHQFKCHPDGRVYGIREIIVTALRDLRIEREQAIEKSFALQLDGAIRENFQEWKSHPSGEVLAARLESQFPLARERAEEVADTAYLTKLKRWYEDAEREPRPLLYFHLNKLALNFTNTDSRNNSGFTIVKNSRILSNSQMVIGGEADMAVELDYGRFNGLTSFLLKYSRITLYQPGQPAVSNDIEDDVVLTTELAYRLYQFSNAIVGNNLSPYLNMAYDTEVTAQEGLSKQKLLRFGYGVKLFEGGVVNTVSFGGVAETEFLPDRTDIEYGMSLNLAASATLREGMLWDMTLNNRYFFKADTDTADDLLFEINARTSVTLPFFENLSFAPFVDALIYRGKIIETTGLNLIVGVSLSYFRQFKL